MSRGAYRKLPGQKSVVLPNAPWHPAEGFVEIRPGVWEPEHYLRTPWELAAPEVKTPEEAQVEYLRCVKSLPYFVLRHCWSIDVDDPSGQPQWRKFPAFPYLRHFFTEVQIPHNTLSEKSRQMLLSWSWMAVFLWDINFHERWGNLLISRRASEVDDGGRDASYNSLLGKIRYIHMALPPYLQQPLEFQAGSVRHVGADSFVTGETGTIKAGRGSTVKRALMDEAAYIEHSETVFKSVHHVAKNGAILNSTANGKGNAFARIRFSTSTTFKKFTFKWIEHPTKAEGLYCTCGWISNANKPATRPAQFARHKCGNLMLLKPKPPEARSPWYDKECRDLTAEQVATEIDISYEKSQRGRVWGFFDSVRHGVDHQSLVGEARDNESLEEYRERYLRAVLQPGLPCVVGWDFGVADPTSLLLGQVLDERAMRIRWIDEFEDNEQDWEYYWQFIQGLWAPLVSEVVGLDLMHYGDPAGKGRGSDLSSWVSNLKSKVPRIFITHEPHVGTRLEWLDFVGARIRSDDFEVSTYCSHLIDSLQNYRFPTDRETGELIPGKQEPVHDQWSHACSALRYVYQFRFSNRLKHVEPTRSANRIFGAGKGHRTPNREALL